MIESRTTARERRQFTLRRGVQRLHRRARSQERFAEAEAIARECLPLWERKMPDDWRTFSQQSLLGHILAAQKKYAEGEPLLLAGYQGMKERETEIPAFAESHYKESVQRLVQFYDATGRSDQAAEWIQKLAAFSQNKPTTNAVSGAKSP